MNKTAISWALGPDGAPGYTWNPVVGCSQVSAGCKNCWAARLAATRLAHLPEYRNLAYHLEVVKGDSDIENFHWSDDVRFLAGRLAEPLRKRKPSGIAVSLMGDLFHPKVTNEQIAAVFGVMAACPQHRFYVCTKRAKRRREWFEWCLSRSAQPALLCSEAAAIRLGASLVKPKDGPWSLPNVVQLTSVEDQATFDERIMDTVATPAAVRGLSIEPLLGPIDLGLMSTVPKDIEPSYMHALMYLKIGWVIVGCESGPGARPMRREWVEKIWRDCIDAEVPFFFKQEMRNGKLNHMPSLAGVTWRQTP